MALGHTSVGRRLNVRREVARIKVDPLSEFLSEAFPETRVDGPRSRYVDSYYLYTRAMERALIQVATCVRYRKGPYYVYRYGGKFGPGQRKLADKARALRPFMELDIATCVLFTRILLDRAIGLSRAFLTGPQLPSFTSFNDHKKFFVRKPDALPQHSEYSEYMRECTAWFDSPLKYVRDKFIVHCGPKHSKWFGIGWEHDDDMLLTVTAKAAGASDSTCLSVWQMSREVEAYLRWFAAYGIAKVTANKKLHAGGDSRPAPK